MLVLLAQSGVDQTSGAYQAGKFIGYAVIAVLLVLLVRWLMNKNR